jgi:spore coat protein A
VGRTRGSTRSGITGTPGEAVYDYPNDQSARLLWYHDHALGYTRLNAYAGLASAYIIGDAAEDELVRLGLIPSGSIPLIIQDKTFKRADDMWGQVGDLWYPSVYESNGPSGRWDLGPGDPPPVPSAIPEFFADTMLVNGAPYPTVQVAPKRYRLRILNGSQARFLNLQMYVADSSPDGITLDSETNPTNPDGPAFIQIATEGGILPWPATFVKYVNGKPVNSNRVIRFDESGDPGAPTFGNANHYNLLLAPAERADLIVDFSGFKGSQVILYNDAPAPFPGGDPRNDYFPGSPDQTGAGASL